MPDIRTSFYTDEDLEREVDSAFSFSEVEDIREAEMRNLAEATTANTSQEQERAEQEAPPLPTPPDPSVLLNEVKMRAYLATAGYRVGRDDMTLQVVIELATKLYQQDVRRATLARGGRRRPNIRTKDFQSPIGKEDIVRQAWPYSAEIEAFASGPTQLFNIGKRIAWDNGVSGDSSLRGSGIAFEIQTPILSGSKGEALIRNVTKAVRSCAINISCGLHLHLDGQALIATSRDSRAFGVKKVNSLKNLWLLHLIFEDVLLSFLPETRRGNRYCQSLRRRYTVSDVQQVTSQEEIEMLWYKTKDSEELNESKTHKYHQTRYSTLNLHSLFAHGHFEIRNHSGTLNPQKILEWANLHTAIAYFATVPSDVLEMNVTLPNGTSTPLNSLLEETNLLKKTKTFLQMLGITEASQAYWLKRQELFAEPNPEELCVA